MKWKYLVFIFFLSICMTSRSQNSAPPVDSCALGVDVDKFQKILIADMDAMLDLWYVKRETANSESILSLLEDDTAAREIDDAILSERLYKIQTVIPVAYNERVKRWIELYAEKRKKSSAALLGLAQYYFPWMQEIFDKHNVPEELIYLTIIESSLNPTAVSRAGATGIWQFMYSTGKMYGLEVNTFIDDRRDPYKATEAAAQHLKDLYNIFHDWGLAISAYNCGPANVRKAIARSGQLNKKPDFWSICKYLPKETQNYFPAFIGALYLMKYHSLHGIEPASIRIPSAVDTIMVSKELHLEQLSLAMNIDLQEIKTLNPQYKRGVIPAYEEPYPLRLKVSDLLKYMDIADSVHAFRYDTFFTPVKVYQNMFTGKNDPSLKTKNIYHYVKKGETLSKIANTYGLSVYELKKMNKLSGNSIKVKQRLLVGYQAVEQPTVPQAARDKPTGMASANTQTNGTASQPEFYTVKKGDTFYAIAKKLNVNAKTLADYNNIKNINVLSVGQKLKIPK